MLLKSAVLATALTVMAAGAATTASAAPRGASGYWGGYSHGHHRIHRTYTTTRCINGRRVLLRMTRWGHVVSRHVVGRCWRPYLQRHWY